MDQLPAPLASNPWTPSAKSDRHNDDTNRPAHGHLVRSCAAEPPAPSAMVRSESILPDGVVAADPGLPAHGGGQRDQSPLGDHRRGIRRSDLIRGLQLWQLALGPE